MRQSYEVCSTLYHVIVSTLLLYHMSLAVSSEQVKRYVNGGDFSLSDRLNGSTRCIDSAECVLMGFHSAFYLLFIRICLMIVEHPEFSIIERHD